MDKILLSTTLMIAILSTTNVFNTSTQASNSTLLPLKIEQQPIKNILNNLIQDKFITSGNELIFNLQPETPEDHTKTSLQGGDKIIIIND